MLSGHLKIIVFVSEFTQLHSGLQGVYALLVITRTIISL